jgi:hypothetical protein
MVSRSFRHSHTISRYWVRGCATSARHRSSPGLRSTTPSQYWTNALRWAALQRGVTVHGTLWLIANGVRIGVLALPDAERLVDQLREAEAWLPCNGAQFLSWAKDRGLLEP